MKTYLAMTIGSLPLLLPAAAFAQGGTMMNGDNWGSGWMGGYGGMGGYAGIWIPVLLVVAIAALLVVMITRKSK